MDIPRSRPARQQPPIHRRSFILQNLFSLFRLVFSKPSPEAEGLEKTGAEAPIFPLGWSYFASRYIKVTICPRVQTLSGLNAVLLVPLVMPLATAHWTAGA